MLDIKWFVPRNSKLVRALLIISSCVFGATTGYDAAIMTGFNIIPAYSEFFHLDTLSKSLLTACYFIGAIVSSGVAPMICNKLGRKNTIFVSVLIKFLGIILMSTSQNFGMFIAGRIILGAGSGVSGTATPTWLAETLPYKTRGAGLSMVLCVYYVGSLTAAGITYGTSSLAGNISWRIPAALQVIWSTSTLCLLCFTPESPRWLASKGYNTEAHAAVAYTHSNGNMDAPETLIQYREIIDTITWEKENGKKMSYIQTFKTPSARRRILLATSVVVFASLSGNSVITYFLGTILTEAGISNSHTQLEINIILSAFNLVCSAIGSQFMDRLGRRKMGLISIGCCTFFLFLVGAFTKLYGSQTENTSGIYATVAMVFLFQGSYAFGMSNLTGCYPPEVLNYAVRANGVAFITAASFSLTIFSVFAMPIALAHIGYKMYMINAVWDILQWIFLYFMWVETNGKTLEEIDEFFDGEKHSEVPDIVNVGKESLDEKTIIVAEKSVN